MTNRIQVLRSSVTGNTPTAGTRAAGELWTNFADLQLGMIDAARNAQRLVAVRYFSTTANYIAGDFVIQAGVLYVAKGAITAGAFNATNWTKVAAATDAGGPYLPVSVAATTYLPLAGGTMAGVLTLQGPPANPLEAATKAYVDAGAFVPTTGGTNTGLNDNRIINGDMRIDARNNGSSGTATLFTVDRWQYIASQAGKFTWQRQAGSVAGFPYCLNFLSSAYTSLSTDYFVVNQPIEADAISDFAWGTAGAQPVTLSFWAFCSQGGTFSGAIKNYASTRSYPFSFALSVNTWTKVVVTIPGDTGGTWVMSGNAGAMYVAFNLGCGANFLGPANAWAGSSYNGVTGSVSLVGFSGAQFYLTGVKLEIGSVATPYNRQSLAKSLADCQRYYQTGQLYNSQASGGLAGATAACSSLCPVAMRSSATMVMTTNACANITSPTLGHNGNMFNCGGVITTAGVAPVVNAIFTASAEL